MLYSLIALISGTLFGLGLLLAGMANPAKVIGFLDLAGNWDPSLGLVMAGAIAVTAPAFFLIRGRKVSLLGAPMVIPTNRSLDWRLIGGSLLFGIGWGIAGFCPGPALVGIGTLNSKAILFVIAMIAGMALFEATERLRA
jgi:uncharacterized membrane protein YedE/YeeE